jgi:hypothetical protein
MRTVERQGDHHQGYRRTPTASVSTVGRALADDHRISDHTKFRVRQAAAEMG